MLFDSQVLTMTAHPSAGSDLPPVPAQRIIVGDPDLLDHHLVLCRFSHDNKLDMKAAEFQLQQQGNPKVVEMRFIKNE